MVQFRDLPRLPAHPGAVVVTRFRCSTLVNFALLLCLHRWIKKYIRRDTVGLVGVALLVIWSKRTVISISLWQDVDSIYSMGQCEKHITVSRIPRRLGIDTDSHIFSCAGEWKQVLFGARIAQDAAGNLDRVV